MSSVTSRAVVRRPRAFIRVAGPDAEDFLQRMVSNDVAAADCDALLLTAKARLIAPLRIVRRAADDFLVLTEPDLGDVVRAQLLRARFAAKVEIEPERHESWLVLGGKCSACKAPIAIRYPVVEIVAAALAVFAIMRFGVTVKGIAAQ